MSNSVIQTSFNSGEWAPALNARVDLTKYHNGAALIRNFFVDYRGGITTRPGSRYVLQAYSTVFGNIRLIPFQASVSVTYMLEFGQYQPAGLNTGYIFFFSNSAPILEATKAITAITNANPGVITSAAHGYTNTQRVFIAAVGGMTQLNGNYYYIANATANTFTLTDLYGVAVNTTAFGVYTAGGTAARIYGINTPYLAAELPNLKFTQNVNTLTICHPNHPTYILTLLTANSWTLVAQVIGSSVAAPGIVSLTTTAAAGTQAISYVVTSVDVNGQESAPSVLVPLANQNLTAGSYTNTLTITAAVGAVSYNVYRSTFSLTNTIPAGTQYGYIGNFTGTVFLDSTFLPNFAISPPIPRNPFSGSGVQSITLTANGTGYTIVPAVTLTASPGITATASCALSLLTATVSNGGQGLAIGTILNGPYGVVLTVLTVSGGVVQTVAITSVGFISGVGVTAPTSFNVSSGGSGQVTITGVWQVSAVSLLTAGTGYAGAPTVGFVNGGTGSGAAATAVLGTASAGNPSVAAYFQQRLVLAGPPGSPQQFNMSQPGSYNNFNVSFPSQADDAIQGTLVSNQLNTIQSMINVPPGLFLLCDRQSWVLNGGSAGAPIDAVGNLVANAHAFNGASSVPPIQANFDILYVQAKGSIVRDTSYDFYKNIYTGTDISVLSSHLFYGYTIEEWAFAEEPYKVVWAVRNDGQLLSLTFLKEQELIAWAHHDTQGSYSSIASITELTSSGVVDAIYVAVQRQVQGQSLTYIERFVELTYPQGYKSSWQVDAGIGYNGAAATTFSGAQHLAGLTCTGLADGVVINFVMPANGTFIFGIGGTAGLTAITNASVVTVGLAFTAQLQTLALDLGEPTVQGKRKKVSALTTRCRTALGLSAGRTFSTLVPMKDLVIGNVGTMSNAVVTDLQTTDARTIMDPQWDVFGQICIQQSNPYPASILGVIPEIEVGDSVK